jgi:SAM-dependent methyltransferase
MRVLRRDIHPRVFLRQMRLAFNALVDAQQANARLFRQMISDPGLMRSFQQFATDMPQAEIVDRCETVVEDRDWREHFSRRLSGHGLEIGALHRPLPHHDGMRVEYVDRHTPSQLRADYPELGEFDFVDPHLIDDAETLATITDGTYDFVVAAHVIEHMRDPIRAFGNWMRVLRPGGLLYLIVPDKRTIFDRRRVRTTLEHLILDYHHPSKERDYDHYVDYAVHVHGKAGSEAMAEADALLARDYSIHYHTFIPTDLVRLVGWISTSLRPLRVIEGPATSPGSEEFHLLLQVP